MSLEERWGKTICKRAMGTAIVRRMSRIRVRIQSSKKIPAEELDAQEAYKVTGIVTIEIGDTMVAPMRFRAEAVLVEGQYRVQNFRPIQGGGGGAAVERLAGLYEGALEEVLRSNPSILL